MKVNTSKSKNAESFYIKQSYLDAHGKSTSRTIRKLGTLNELLIEHGPTRDDVMNWAKEQKQKSMNKRKKTIVFRLSFIQTGKFLTEKNENFKAVIYSYNPSIINWD